MFLKLFISGFRKFLTVLLIVGNLFTPVTGRKIEKIKVYKEGCNASIGVISDIHLKDNFFRQGNLEMGLQDMADAEDTLDAVAFCGDITDHGYIDMWDCFAESMGKYDIAKQTIIVEGNHDTWGPDRDNIETVKQTFIDYNKKISNRDVNEMYYSTNVNGYPVIVLGSEEDHTNATISQTQINWFAQEMENASKTGLPIFVFLHQSINGTHGLPYNWECEEEEDPAEGGIGDASDDIFNIIKKYNNVFYISGHIHAGLSAEEDNNYYTSIEKHDGYTLVNVPCYGYPDVQRGGWVSNGTGFIFEIYDDQVMIRARNFVSGKWLSKYDVTVDIIK